MSRMRPRILVALPFALAIAACQPQPAPAPVAAPAADASATQPSAGATAQDDKSPTPAGTDVVSVVDNTPMAHVEAASGTQLDGKSLAGKFSDGESVLELRADGSYVQTLRVAGSTIDSDGHWAPDGAHAVKLDPNSKQAEDVRFEVASADLLKGDDGREFKRIVE